jgi:glycerophosphoryl diester phosphodiesterase
MATTYSEAHVLAPTLPTTHPLVIAHRGASGYRPEHTLDAYRLAIELGAGWIEPDLVPTKDGVLVARHENNLLGTTDVAVRPEFADRRTTKMIDDVVVTGWFTEDFTLSELKALRATERLPLVRPGNVAYDGSLEIPTFDEVLQLAAEETLRTGREIGVVPETKHPSYFAALGLAMESSLVRSLEAAGLNRPDAPVIIQSFEVDNLRLLDRMTSVPIVQLVDLHQPERLTPSGLRAISTYAEWVGPHKELVLSDPSVVAEAHRAGLRVLAWTVRPENQFLAPRFRIGTNPHAAGDWRAEVAALVDAGVDGVFADYPDAVNAALVG